MSRRAVTRLGALGLAFAAAAGATSASPSDYADTPRVDYLARALDAVRGLGPDGRRALEDELYTGARTRCRGAYGPPTAGCLLDLAAATCGDRAACHLAADVILVSVLSEHEVVDEDTRVALVAGSADYRAAMRAELTARRATLAAELVLAQPGADADLPARIDRFCARRERDPAWQRCATALIWYIADGEAPR